MEDYRLTYLTKDTKDEVFKIVGVGVNFILEGDKGTRLEMKPHIPHKIVVDQGDSILTVTKTAMTVRKKVATRAEKMKMDGAE